MKEKKRQFLLSNKYAFRHGKGQIKSKVEEFVSKIVMHKRRILCKESNQFDSEGIGIAHN